MTDSGPILPWLVIRQEGNGNRYRVGCYATKTEAEEVAERLDTGGRRQLYVVVRVGRTVS
ncbi:SPOR domain-containing protein [Streptomyces sp. NPDC051162]|uniref:SPOR domain-containing protein n=1 Tax=unclassified Streptomyces TaxID=2593676 RepID=UPI00343F652E